MRFSRDGCAFLSQAIAFNALFAVFPLLVLILSGASLVYPNANGAILSFVDEFAPALHQTVASNLQTYVYGRGISSLIAFGVVIWAGKNLFMGLAYALNRALAVPKSRPLVHDIALSIITLPIAGLLMVGAIALPILVSLFVVYAHVPDPNNVSRGMAYALSMLLSFIIVVVLYTFLPNRRISWRFAVPGATFVALMWPAAQYAFAFYTLHVNFTRVYGALSAPLVLLLWFYLLGAIFFFGAELSAGWAHHKGTVTVAPLVDPVRPTERNAVETESEGAS